MGRETVHVEIRAICSVSRHNSEQDGIDDALTEELQHRLAEAARPILEDPRYEGIVSFTEGLERR